MCGKFAGRKYLTIEEVAEGAAAAGQGRLSANVVREGLKAAGCESHAQVRAGRSRLSIWFGPGMDAGERAVAKNMRPSVLARQAQDERTAAANAALANAVGI